MRLVFGHDKAVADWMGARLERPAVPPYMAVGIIDEAGALIGGWLLNGYNGANIDATIYGPGCMTRRTLKAFFAHVFTDLKCCRVTGRVARSNKAERDVLSRLGFIHEGVMKRFYGSTHDDDAFVFGLLRDDCRFLGH